MPDSEQECAMLKFLESPVVSPSQNPGSEFKTIRTVIMQTMEKYVHRLKTAI
jgi:hypothetical protein